MWKHRLVIGVCLLALVPIAVSIIQHGTGGWVPDGDDAWVARRTMQVATTHPPLIGQESTASDMPLDAGLSHLGPTSYYVMAVPYGLTGWSPAGLTLGAGLIVGAAVVAIIVLANRNAGDRGAIAAGIVMAGLAARLGQEWLVRPSSSALAVVPVAACLVGLWSYLRNDRLGFVAVLVFGSFAVQTSLVVLPLAGSVVLAAVVVALVRWRKTGTLPLSGRWWWAAAALAVTWVPPLIDQLTRSPGNLADFFHYLYSDASGGEREGKVAAALGLGPAIATVVDAVANPWGIGHRRIVGQGVWVVTLDSLGLIAPAIFVVLAGAALWWAITRRRTAAKALFVVAGVASVLAIGFFSRRPAETLFNPTYFVLWIQAVAVVWWLAIVLCGVDAAITLLGPRLRSGRAATRAGRPGPIIMGGLAVMAVLVVLASWQPLPRDEAQRVRSLSNQLRGSLPVGTYEVEGKGLVAWTSTAKGIGAELIAHGYDMRFTEFGGMVDEGLRRAEPNGAQIFVVAQEGSDITVPDRSDPSLLAVFRDDRAQVLVFYVPGGEYASLCEQVAIARSAPLPGLTDAQGNLVNPTALADLFGGIKLDQLADDVGDPAYQDAVAQLAEVRDELVTRLRDAAPGTPALSLDVPSEAVVALGTIFSTYDERCRVGPPQT